MSCTVGPFLSPIELNFSNVDYSSRELTFSWNPVGPDCPAIHYNILASNCGSCPTTTNHTNVTCTGVLLDGSTCTLAVQTVACENITGEISDPISVTLYVTELTTKAPMGTLHSMENLETHTSDTTVKMHNSATNIVYIISFSSLAALIAGVVVSTTAVVIIIILKRNKAKTVGVLASPNGAEGTTHNEPTYENVTGPLHSVSTIDTHNNVAYGHTRTLTRARGTAQDVTTYENVTGPIPSVSAIQIDTQA